MTNTSYVKNKKVLSQNKVTKKSKMSYELFKKRIKDVILKVFRYALIICLSYMILYPLLQMLSMTFRDPYEIGLTSSVWIPQTPTLDNLKVATTIMDYPKAVLYTSVCTFVVMFLQIFCAALAGYSLARLKPLGCRLIMACVILTIIVPPTSLMLPQYIHFQNFDIFGIFKLITGEKLNLLKQPATLFILSAFGQGLKGGLFVYIFRQFFRGMPKELEEAAYVDGAGILRIFFKIVLPCAKPSLISVGLLSFVWNWNDTYLPSLFNPTDNYLRMRIATLSIPTGGSSRVQQAIGTVTEKIPTAITRLDSSMYDSAILKSCTLLTVIPLILVFFLVQKRFVEGIERTGIVG